MDANSEEALIDRAVGGDCAAIERLLLMHYASLVQHVTARMRPEFQGLISVEDVLQEAFIHVFRDISRFVPGQSCSFIAWVKSIADNRIRDLSKTLARRKRGGDRHRALGPTNNQSSSVADLAHWLSADDPTPSRVAARHEMVHVVQIALSALPADYREAIRLRYLEGKSIKETAVLMQCSPGAVRGLLDRARHKLRATMGRSSQYFSKD